MSYLASPKSFTVVNGVGNTAPVDLSRDYADTYDLLDDIDTQLSELNVYTEAADALVFRIISSENGADKSITITGPDASSFFNVLTTSGSDFVDNDRQFTIGDSVNVGIVTFNTALNDMDDIVSAINSALVDDKVYVVATVTDSTHFRLTSTATARSHGYQSRLSILTLVVR